MAEDLLTAFGRSLGLVDFSWPDSGLAAFAFDQRGTLYLQLTETSLLVSLSRAVDLRDQGAVIMKRALRLCHYRQPWPYSIRVGLRGDEELVFSLHLPRDDITLPELERALDILTRLHEAAHTTD